LQLAKDKAEKIGHRAPRPGAATVQLVQTADRVVAGCGAVLESAERASSTR